MPKPAIDAKKCTVCGECAEVCPVSVFMKESDKIMVKHPEECIGCRACEVSCPAEAVKVKD